ncbi:MAG: glycine--tRNA ligase [Candidatus Aenigmarchaeota archaeon]|nr:glycine--tRNA ligase [Candidatus Aenigmarchaeota archaeon]
MKDIMELAKRRGFFWQAAPLHNPIAGFYDYAPMGSLVKRRFESLWRNYFLSLDDNFYEIEASVIMPENVFKASGHLASFVDPIAKCKKCGHAERADHLLEDVLKESFEGLAASDMIALIKKHGIKCQKCKGPLEEVGVLNMMFPLDVGTGKEAKKAYLTPETAQGAYVNFALAFDVMRRKLPLGLAIIGKAFRNEISPRQGLIRMREFTQAELQIFFDPDAITSHPKFKDIEGYQLRLLPAKSRDSGKVAVLPAGQAKELGLPEFYLYHMAMVQKFYLEVLRLPEQRFRFRELVGEEKAFYNKYHWDIEANLDTLGGWKEIAGLHYRTDHDLQGHGQVSGQKVAVNIEGKEFVPHVLEISMGVDRNVYGLLDLAYSEEPERVVLKFPRAVAPFDAGIFPLVRKDGLDAKARVIFDVLKQHGFRVFYDESGSIGRRYRRIDEIGVPAGITVDYDSMQQEDVTLRDRDSMQQVRIKIEQLPAKLRAFLQGAAMEASGK